MHMAMDQPIHTKAFKSGNSVAVRLPKGLGVAPNTEIEIIRQGRDFLLRRVVDPVKEKAKLRKLVAMLDEICPVGEIEKRDADIFPDRPGLY